MVRGDKEGRRGTKRFEGLTADGTFQLRQGRPFGNQSLGSVVRLVAAAEPTIEPTFIRLVALLRRVVILVLVLVVVATVLLLAAFASDLGRFDGGDVAGEAPEDGDDTLVETARVGSELLEDGLGEIECVPAP